jgi:hypothetical protein
MPEQWDMLAYYLPESTLDRNGLNAHRRNHPQASSARVALRRAASLVDYRPRPEPGESFVLMAEAQPFDAETYAKLVIQLARHLAEQDHETDG